MVAITFCTESFDVLEGHLTKMFPAGEIKRCSSKDDTIKAIGDDKLIIICVDKGGRDMYFQEGSSKSPWDYAVEKAGQLKRKHLY